MSSRSPFSSILPSRNYRNKPTSIFDPEEEEIELPESEPLGIPLDSNEVESVPKFDDSARERLSGDTFRSIFDKPVEPPVSQTRADIKASMPSLRLDTSKPTVKPSSDMGSVGLGDLSDLPFKNSVFGDIPLTPQTNNTIPTLPPKPISKPPLSPGGNKPSTVIANTGQKANTIPTQPLSDQPKQKPNTLVDIKTPSSITAQTEKLQSSTSPLQSQSVSPKTLPKLPNTSINNLPGGPPLNIPAVTKSAVQPTRMLGLDSKVSDAYSSRDIDTTKFEQPFIDVPAGFASDQDTLERYVVGKLGGTDLDISRFKELNNGTGRLFGLKRSFVNKEGRGEVAGLNDEEFAKWIKQNATRTPDGKIRIPFTPGSVDQIRQFVGMSYPNLPDSGKPNYATVDASDLGLSSPTANYLVEGAKGIASEIPGVPTALGRVARNAPYNPFQDVIDLVTGDASQRGGALLGQGDTGRSVEDFYKLPEERQQQIRNWANNAYKTAQTVGGAGRTAGAYTLGTILAVASGNPEMAPAFGKAFAASVDAVHAAENQPGDILDKAFAGAKAGGISLAVMNAAGPIGEGVQEFTTPLREAAKANIPGLLGRATVTGVNTLERGLPYAFTNQSANYINTGELPTAAGVATDILAGNVMGLAGEAAQAYSRGARNGNGFKGGIGEIYNEFTQRGKPQAIITDPTTGRVGAVYMKNGQPEFVEMSPKLAEGYLTSQNALVKPGAPLPKEFTSPRTVPPNMFNALFAPGDVKSDLTAIARNQVGAALRGEQPRPFFEGATKADYLKAPKGGEPTIERGPQAQTRRALPPANEQPTRPQNRLLTQGEPYPQTDIEAIANQRRINEQTQAQAPTAPTKQTTIPEQQQAYLKRYIGNINDPAILAEMQGKTNDPTVTKLITQRLNELRPQSPKTPSSLAGLLPPAPTSQQKPIKPTAPTTAKAPSEPVSIDRVNKALQIMGLDRAEADQLIKDQGVKQETSNGDTITNAHELLDSAKQIISERRSQSQQPTKPATPTQPNQPPLVSGRQGTYAEPKPLSEQQRTELNQLKNEYQSLQQAPQGNLPARKAMAERLTQQYGGRVRDTETGTELDLSIDPINASPNSPLFGKVNVTLSDPKTGNILAGENRVSLDQLAEGYIEQVGYQRILPTVIPNEKEEKKPTGTAPTTPITTIPQQTTQQPSGTTPIVSSTPQTKQPQAEFKYGVRKQGRAYIAPDGTKFEGQYSKSKAEYYAYQKTFEGATVKNYFGGKDIVEKVEIKPDDPFHATYTVRDEKTGKVRVHSTRLNEKDVISRPQKASQPTATPQQIPQTLTTQPVSTNARRQTGEVPVSQAEYRRRERAQYAGEQKLVPNSVEDINKLAERFERDPLTGSFKNEDVNPTIEEAANYAAETGKQGAYGQIRIVNLGGANAGLGSATAANAAFGSATDIIKEEIGKLNDGQNIAIDFRSGGPTISIVSSGPKANQQALNNALATAQQRINTEVVEKYGLNRLKHPKGEMNKSGFGIVFTTQPINGKIDDIGAFRKSANTSLNEIEDARTVDKSIVGQKGAQAPVRSKFKQEWETRPLPKTTAGDFKTVDELLNDEYQKLVDKYGLTPAQAEKLRPKPDRDELTGYYSGDEREFTVRRAIEHTDRTGERVHYAEADIANLGGLNRDLGEKDADRVFKRFTDILKGELSQEGWAVNFFRHGGDEVGFVIAGPPETLIREALQKAQEKIQNYVEETTINGVNLSQIKHTKEGKPPGTGITFGVKQITPNDRSVDDSIEAAGAEIENKKKGLPYVNIKQTGENGVGTSGGQTRRVSESPSSDRTTLSGESGSNRSGSRVSGEESRSGQDLSTESSSGQTAKSSTSRSDTAAEIKYLQDGIKFIKQTLSDAYEFADLEHKTSLNATELARLDQLSGKRLNLSEQLRYQEELKEMQKRLAELGGKETDDENPSDDNDNGGTPPSGPPPAPNTPPTTPKAPSSGGSQAQTTEQANKTAFASVKTTPRQANALIDNLLGRLERGEAIKTPTELFKITDQYLGGHIGTDYEPQEAYNNLEGAVNAYLLKRIPTWENRTEALKEMRDLMDLLPYQRARSESKVRMQQYSTPPPLAYIASIALNPQRGEIALEPSAGTGGLAVFLQANGTDTYVNEIDPKRLDILEDLGFDKGTDVNAEQLNDRLGKALTDQGLDNIKPTAILMNPPFSAAANVDKKQIDTGAIHVDSALKRLADGGRLVAIVGGGMSMHAPAYKKWFDKWANQYYLVANIGINGSEYEKYGTGFDNRLLVIDKTGPTPDASKIITADNLNWNEAFNKVQEIGDGRTKPQIKRNSDLGRDSNNVRGDSRGEPTSSVGGLRRTELSNSPERGDLVSGQEQGRDTENRTVSKDLRGTEPGSGPSTSGQRGSDRRSESTSRDADAAAIGSKPGGTGRETEPTGIDKPLQLEEAAIQKREAEEGGTFVKYAPPFKQTKPHPGNIVETVAMAGVSAPPLKLAKLDLPSQIVNIWQQGKISDLQFETVTRADARHNLILPDGSVGGFFLGDGTGVGKGRQIAAIAYNNWLQGRKRQIWVSVNDDLLPSADRDLKDIGANIPLKALTKIKLGDDIEDKFKDGIIFLSYSILAQEKKQGQKQSRLEQLQKWLGDEPVIFFDEVHKAKNLIEEEEALAQKASQTALAVDKLQKEAPKTRVLYVSATGASEVRHLGIMSRLGLWGTGTTFPNGVNDFIAAIDGGGLGAMEMVAQDMKALGLYVSRSLSFQGTTFNEATHELSPEQRKIYTIAAEAWRLLLDNTAKATQVTGGGKKQLGNALGQFWSSHQRFFRVLLTALKVPTLIKLVGEKLAEDKSVVISVVGTGEANAKREEARVKEEGLSFDDMDFTPRQIVLNYLQKFFPVKAYEQYEDENGKVRTRVAKHADGTVVESEEAKQLRDQTESIIEKMMSGDFSLPDNPIDQILRTFGTDQVAELTKRNKQYVVNPQSGRIEPRKRPKSVAEMDAFQNGTKRIAIISDAASTGISLHASNSNPEAGKKRRVHIVLELGWSADKQMQSFGRTHRSDQASAPEYILLSTDAGGEKRFSSTIARRLADMGALTKGERSATGSDAIAQYNFETPEGRTAVKLTYDGLFRPFRLPKQFEDKITNSRNILMSMGVLRVDEKAQTLELRKEYMEDVPRFLNRVLALNIDDQNAVFDLFMDNFRNVIEASKANGTFDAGARDIKAEKIKISTPQVISTDKLTGAETKYYKLNLTVKSEPTTLDYVLDDLENAESAEEGFYKQKGGKERLIFAHETRGRTDPTTGLVVRQFTLRTPDKKYWKTIPYQELRDDYQSVKKDEATKQWQDEYDKVPLYEDKTSHVISGALLPLWDKLSKAVTAAKAGGLKIVRVEDSETGFRIVGVQIPDKAVAGVLQSLGIGLDMDELTPEDIFDLVIKQGATVPLDGGIELQQRSIYNVPGIEIRATGNGALPSSIFPRLKGYGLSPYYGSGTTTRFFLPTDRDKGIKILEKLLADNPVKPQPKAENNTKSGKAGERLMSGIEPPKISSEGGFIDFGGSKSTGSPKQPNNGPKFKENLLANVGQLISQAQEIIRPFLGSTRNVLQYELPKLGYSKAAADDAADRALKFKTDTNKTLKHVEEQITELKKGLPKQVIYKGDRGLPVTVTPDQMNALLWVAAHAIDHFEGNKPVFNNVGIVWDIIKPEELDDYKLDGKPAIDPNESRTIEGRFILYKNIATEDLADGRLRIYRRFEPNEAEDLYARAITGRFDATYEKLQKGTIKPRGSLLNILKEVDWLRREAAAESGLQLTPGHVLHVTDNSTLVGYRKQFGRVVAGARKIQTGALLRSDKVKKDIFKSLRLMMQGLALEKLRNQYVADILDLLGRTRVPNEKPYTLVKGEDKILGKGLVDLVRRGDPVIAARGLDPAELRKAGFMLQARGLYVPNIALVMLNEDLGQNKGNFEQTLEERAPAIHTIYAALQDVFDTAALSKLSAPASALRDFTSTGLIMFPIKFYEDLWAGVLRWQRGEDAAFVEAKQDVYAFGRMLKRVFSRVPEHLKEEVLPDSLYIDPETKQGRTLMGRYSLSAANKAAFLKNFFDAVGKRLVYDSVLMAEAERAARKGNTSNLQKSMEEFLKNIPEEAEIKARRIANEYSFGGDELNTWIRRVGRSLTMKALAPVFYKFFAKLMGFLWQRSPLGFMSSRSRLELSQPTDPTKIELTAAEQSSLWDKFRIRLHSAGGNGGKKPPIKPPSGKGADYWDEWQHELDKEKARRAQRNREEKDRAIARIFTSLLGLGLGVGAAAIGLTAARDKDEKGEPLPREFDTSYTVPLFTDKNGYQYRASTKGLTPIPETVSIFDMLTGRIAPSEFFSDTTPPGPVFKPAAKFFFGMAGEYDKHKPVSTMLGEEVASGVPFMPWINFGRRLFDDNLRKDSNSLGNRPDVANDRGMVGNFSQGVSNFVSPTTAKFGAGQERVNQQTGQPQRFSNTNPLGAMGQFFSPVRIQKIDTVAKQLYGQPGSKPSSFNILDAQKLLKDSDITLPADKVRELQQFVQNRLTRELQPKVFGSAAAIVAPGQRPIPSGTSPVIGQYAKDYQTANPEQRKQILERSQDINNRDRWKVIADAAKEFLGKPVDVKAKDTPEAANNHNDYARLDKDRWLREVTDQKRFKDLSAKQQEMIEQGINGFYNSLLITGTDKIPDQYLPEVIDAKSKMLQQWQQDSRLRAEVLNGIYSGMEAKEKAKAEAKQTEKPAEKPKASAKPATSPANKVSMAIPKTGLRPPLSPKQSKQTDNDEPVYHSIFDSIFG